MALITLAQQNLIKPISQNWANTVKVSGGVTNFVQLQTEIENGDLKDLLGASFLLDIQKTPLSYTDLLDGLEYTNCNDDLVKFEGIRYQLAYMIYSEYIRVSGIQDTFIGMARKQRDESTDLSEPDKRNEQNRTRKMALRDFELMKEYLNENDDSYPLWECTNRKKIYTPKFTTIRKTVK